MAKTNWANATKAKLETVTVNDGFETVGKHTDFEPIVAYYQFNEPRNAEGIGRLLVKGAELTGSYEGHFTGKKYGKRTYKLRTSEGIIGLPECKQLNDTLGTLPVGTTVKVYYTGKNPIKSGPNAGKGMHSFIVRKPKE